MHKISVKYSVSSNHFVHDFFATDVVRVHESIILSKYHFTMVVDSVHSLNESSNHIYSDPVAI